MSEESLPDGWKLTYNQDGIPYWYDVNDLTDPVWVRPTEPTPKLPSGWEKVKGNDGKVYYLNKISKKTQDEFPVAGQAFDAEHLPRDVGVFEEPPQQPPPQQPQNMQPVVDISSLVNRQLTEQEIETIRKMNNGQALVDGLVQYDAGFDELKNSIGAAQPLPFDLSGYTKRLEEFRVTLIAKLAIIKEKLERLSLLEGLSDSLIQKLNAAKELFKSATNKLASAGVQNKPEEYEALGEKITELETLIAEIDTYNGMGAHAPVGGRRKSKTKHRKSRGKKTKTKRVKRTQTRKRKRNGGKCKCSLWNK
uniref:WW domain-containing protein n=1 Tax=viral metagenome TaxID=1070528 RepID=A0A6C0E655_9ZZZZ